MGRYRTINVDLNRQYRNDLNANFAQIEQDILNLENSNIQEQLMAELRRIELESKERDDLLVGESLEALIQSINDAKNNANTSASNADLKATHAQTQGDYAKTQGDYAKAQGDYALSKGDYANEKAVLADEAAGNANNEANNLSQLKVDAVTATQNANTATTNANNSATYANTQGDYAKLQADRAKDVVDGTGLLTQTDIGELVAGFNASGQVLDKNGNVVEGKVKSVNGIAPDGTGNITVPTFSGNYNDLTNKPTIPSSTSEITNNSGFITIDRVTKTQVGLSNVQNYGLATQAEAEAGTSTSKYMTPQRTKQAIDTLQAIKSVNGQIGNVEIPIPSNGIVESGANGNGYYVRFADGTQICYASRTYDATSTNYSLLITPALFIEHPYGGGMLLRATVSATHMSDFTKLGIAAYTDRWQFRMAQVGTSTDLPVIVFSIGRWK